jgi:hypothetical protein
MNRIPHEVKWTAQGVSSVWSTADMRRPANGRSSGSRAPLPSTAAMNLSFSKRPRTAMGDLVVLFYVPLAGKGEGVGRFGGAGAGEMGVMGIMGGMRVRRANRAGVA